MTTAPDTAPVTEIIIASIVTGLNNRTVFKDGPLEELAKSINDHGLIQPITVRPYGPDTFQLVAGERRVRAVKLLGWETIPAIVRELSDQQARAIMLIENNQREDVDPIDQATGYQAYMAEFGVDVPTLAAMANVAPVIVYKRLDLLKLIPKVQDRVRQNPELLTLFELMTVLDANRQALALKVLTRRSRPPTLAEFRRVVNDFKADQDKEDGTQAALFSAEQLAELWVQKFEAADAAGGKARRAMLPIDTRFPEAEVKDRRQWLANQFKTWADKLQAQGYEEGAAAVYTLTEYCIRQNRLEADESQWPEFFI